MPSQMLIWKEATVLDKLSIDFMPCSFDDYMELFSHVMDCSDQLKEGMNMFVKMELQGFALLDFCLHHSDTQFLALAAFSLMCLPLGNCNVERNFGKMK